MLGSQVVSMSDGLGPEPQRVAAEFVFASGNGLLRLRAQPVGGAPEARLPAMIARTGPDREGLWSRGRI
jgi:hypothetical protein